MRTVGFEGGNSVYELGSTSDVVLFFECIEASVAQAHTERNWALLTDRLYRRYLRQEELGSATELMSEVNNIFAKLPNSFIEWKHMPNTGNETRLNKDLPTLADIFAKYFENFNKACGSAVSFMDCFKIYQPVRIVISDIPWLALESQRKLDEYEALEGKPFWLR